MREQLGSEVTNPAIDLEIADKRFFEALDRDHQAGRGHHDFFTGDGTIGIMAGGSMDDAPTSPPPKDHKPMVLVHRPVPRRAQADRAMNRDFTTGASTANLQLEAAWEPRLRPMLLKLNYENLKIIDDRNKEVDAQVNMEVRRGRRPAREPRRPRSTSTSRPPNATPRSWPRSRSRPR